MRRTTFIQLPHSIDDPIVLRRFLDKVIQQVDTAFQLRGDGGFATTDMATRLNRATNNKFKAYMRADGSNLTGKLTYPIKVTITDPNDLTSKEYVDNLAIKPKPAPSQLEATATLEEVISTINELLVTLKDTGILS